MTTARSSTALRTLAESMTEAELLTNVIQLAHTHHWLANHQRPARVGNRTITAVMGDTGLPDLVLAKNGRTILAELKAEDGATTHAQDRWLLASGGHLWKPSDWLNNTIHRVLSSAPGLVPPSTRQYGECATCYQRVGLTARGRCKVHDRTKQRCPGSGLLPIYTRAPATHIPGTTTAHLPAGETAP